jgi:proline dehydrogenase
MPESIVSSTLSFQDTEVAFRGLSDTEMRRKYLLFRLMEIKVITNIGIFFMKWALRLRLPIKKIIKVTLFSQFCGGEDLEEVKEKAKHLHHRGIGIIPDFAAEGKNQDRHFNRARNEAIETIKAGYQIPGFGFGVFKAGSLTSKELLAKVQKGGYLSKEDSKRYQAFVNRVQEISSSAMQAGVSVLCDAEESWIQNEIDRLIMEMSKTANRNAPILYMTFQMYRTDSVKRVQDYLEHAQANEYLAAVKLVRGAYWETEQKRAKEKGYANPVFTKKEDTDAAYRKGLSMLMEANAFVCLGSHNEADNHILAEHILSKDLSANKMLFSFAQLFGMSDHISQNLAHSGLRVFKYLPYGKVHWVMPYLFRRAQENSAVMGGTSRERKLIEEEIKRRKGLNQNP